MVGERQRDDDERGQALTLEAIVGGLVLLTAVGFALQMTAVTPLSASTSSQHLENQLGEEAEGVLASTAETGALKDAVLYWDSEEEEFHGTGDRSFYTSGPPDNEFGDELRRTFGDRNIAFNVVVRYQTENLGVSRQRMVRQGQPSDNAMSASRTVVLVDNDVLLDENGEETEERLAESEQNFYAPNTADDNPYYNVVTVEVIVWRI